ncbi:MAG TPA: hypothetical protein VLA56_19130 [Pseudomonadales bacterium]|nr:hypothetical protein [Pseudomonadales bacterium]
MEMRPAVPGFSGSGALVLLFTVVMSVLSALEGATRGTFAPWVAAPGFLALGIYVQRFPIDWRAPIPEEIRRIGRDAPTRTVDVVLSAVGSGLVILSALLRLLGV